MAADHPLDVIIVNLDRALRAVTGTSRGTGRAYPAAEVAEGELDAPAQRHAAGLMRVNHAGEVAAQALYHGQSLTARGARVRTELERAAAEEEDHLLWCRRRLDELNAGTSMLDPLWYAGSFAIGTLAGLAGDRVNLGFLAETERQVEAHLAAHLADLAPHDRRSRAVLERMQHDEAQHARMAENGGAAPLPAPVARAMRMVSRLMTRTAYWV
jgi:ubiquinone biosynthesis monooxygenase Coq7